MKNLLIVAILLLTSKTLLAQDLCVDYFAQIKIEIRPEMTKEERREAEAYNLNIRLTYDNSPLKVSDLRQLQRVKKWQRDRSFFAQLQLTHARYEAAVYEIYARTLHIISSKDPITDIDLKEVLRAIKWFKENGAEQQYVFLKESFQRGQANSFRNLESILKKSLSKINKLETKELFKFLGIAEHLELLNLASEIRLKLKDLTDLTVSTALLTFEFGRQPKSNFKHNHDQHLSIEFTRHLLEIGSDYVNSGHVISTSVGGTIVGYRARKFNFRGIAYRILYTKLENGKIYVEFMGSHEEYNMYFK